MNSEERKACSILIIDNVPPDLQLLAPLLNREGYTLSSATSGEQALALAAAEPYDLILLDVRLTGMAGREVCRRLKNDPRTAGIPVIFLAAKSETEDLLSGFHQEAVDYITRPFQAGEFLARVRTYLELKKSRDALDSRNRELEKALAEVRTLRGILPICSSCKRIRKTSEEGAETWVSLSNYLSENTEADLTHTICPICAKKLYPQLF